MNIEVLKDFWIPHLLIDMRAMVKVRAYVDGCEKEVGWMGLLRIEDSETSRPWYTLHSPYCPAQEVNNSTCDLDPDGKGSFAEWAIGLGADAQYIKWWGHSHVDMGVSPSKTDMDTFWEHVENDPGSPFVMTIHNKSRESYTNIYLGNGVYVKDAPLLIDYGYPEMKEEAIQELKDNVREKVYVGSNKTNGYSAGEQAGSTALQRTRSGGDREQHSSTASPDRNAERNAMGLRQGGESQSSKSTVQPKGRRKKQSRGGKGKSAA